MKYFTYDNARNEGKILKSAEELVRVAVNDGACRRTLYQIKQKARLFRLATTCVKQVKEVVLGTSVISKEEILDKEVFDCLLVHSLDRSVDRYNLLFADLFLVRC